MRSSLSLLVSASVGWPVLFAGSATAAAVLLFVVPPGGTPFVSLKTGNAPATTISTRVKSFMMRIGDSLLDVEDFDAGDCDVTVDIADGAGVGADEGHDIAVGGLLHRWHVAAGEDFLLPIALDPCYGLALANPRKDLPHPCFLLLSDPP